MPDLTDLNNLHDIVAPKPVSWLPPAPGWYALALTLLLVLLWVMVAWYRRRQRNAYRRQAADELARIETALAGEKAKSLLLPRLPELLKRAAIAAYGRGEVASLCGEPWLDFLDHRIGKPLFSGANGKLLLNCSYGSAALLDNVSLEQAQNLCRAIHIWLVGHRVIVDNKPHQTNLLNAGGSA
jgi:hypothetical protein